MDVLQERLTAVLTHASRGAAVIAADGTLRDANEAGVRLAASLNLPDAFPTLAAKACPSPPGSLPGAELIPLGTTGEWLLVERDGGEAAARAQAEAEERLRRQLLRDVLRAATQDKLRLAFEPDDLPDLLPSWSETPLLPDTSLSPLRSAVLEAARRAGLPDDRAHSAALAAGEVAMNAVVHGGGGHARLGGAANTERGGTVQIAVEDRGPGIALDALPQSALTAGYSSKSSMGMGLFLTLQESDRVYLQTGAEGTVIVVEVDRLPAQPLWLRRAGLAPDDLDMNDLPADLLPIKDCLP